MESDIFHRDSKLTLVPIPQSEQNQENYKSRSDLAVLNEKYVIHCAFP